VACSLAENTVCVQQWVATISTAGECNIQGTFSMQDNVLCRDVDPNTVQDGKYGTYCNFTGGPVSPPTTLLSVSIGKTSLCPGDDTDASGHLAYELQSYFDVELQEQQEVFQTGDMAYFVFEITSPQASIDSITFHQINVRAGSGAGATVDSIFQVAEPRGNASIIPTIDFVILREVHEILPPGEHGRLAFGFRLLRQFLTSVLLALTPDGETDTLTVEVTVDILYHGNQRRTQKISTLYDVSDATISESIVLTVMEGNGDVAVTEDVDSYNASAASIVSVFSPLAYVLMALIVVILRV